MAVHSKDEARKVAESLLAKIELCREEASRRGERFEALTREELVSRIKGQTSNSPFFYMQSWSGVSPGGSTTYKATAFNPDPAAYVLFSYLLFGPANFITSPDLALTTADPRFPHYFQWGLVGSGDSVTMTFTIDVPAGLRLGFYIGNCFLLRQNGFGVGSYIDRASFEMYVS